MYGIELLINNEFRQRSGEEDIIDVWSDFEIQVFRKRRAERRA
jgi:hypothetical protein